MLIFIGYFANFFCYYLCFLHILIAVLGFIVHRAQYVVVKMLLNYCLTKPLLCNMLHRLKELLRNRLIECGWRDELKQYCKGQYAYHESMTCAFGDYFVAVGCYSTFEIHTLSPIPQPFELLFSRFFCVCQ